MDGQIEIVSCYDNPAMNASDDFKNKILHARFSFGNYVLFGSDVMPKKQDEQLTSNIAISLGLHDELAARNIFDRLSAEGDISLEPSNCWIFHYLQAVDSSLNWKVSKSGRLFAVSS